MRRGCYLGCDAMRRATSCQREIADVRLCTNHKGRKLATPVIGLGAGSALGCTGLLHWAERPAAGCLNRR